MVIPNMKLDGNFYYKNSHLGSLIAEIWLNFKNLSVKSTTKFGLFGIGLRDNLETKKHGFLSSFWYINGLKGHLEPKADQIYFKKYLV